MRGMDRLSVAAAAALLSSAGCVLDEVDLEGHACPCALGWVCDDSRGVCVRGGAGGDGGALDAREPDELDGGGTDARSIDASRVDTGSPVDANGMDAGAMDAGAMDAGPRDAGPREAGPPDAGPPDTGPPDAGPPDMTACDDLYAGASFCDGFESSGLSGWGWRNEVSGVVERTTVRAYRGTGSMRATTSAGSGRAALGAIFPTVSSGDIWFRAYLYIPSGYTMDTVSLLALTEGVDPWEGTALQAVSLDRAHVWVGPEGRAFTATDIVPRDRWFCYRGHLVLSNTAGVLEAFIDATRVIYQTGIDTRSTSGLANVIVGVEWSSTAQTTAEVFVDEVVVDVAEARCD